MNAAVERFESSAIGERISRCLSHLRDIGSQSGGYAREAKIVMLDSSKYRNLCLSLKVASLPTFLFFNDGKEIERLTGSSLNIDTVEATLRRSVLYHGKN